MIFFFVKNQNIIYAVSAKKTFGTEEISKLEWLFGEAESSSQQKLLGQFIGPRASMVTPWSTNAVEITQNMGITGIDRIEVFEKIDDGSALPSFDQMIFQSFQDLGQDLFTLEVEREAVQAINDIAAYNIQEGLSLSDEEVSYLEQLSKRIGRKLTDSEVFGFSQVNSEHCRHKIFNGTFVIDGTSKDASLFQLIKNTSKTHPDTIVSAYKDNVAFVKGPKATQFAPKSAHQPDFYEESDFESVISLKAETHNFPTTVEPFNGAATGSGGEIRDRLAGGKGSLPLAGTAVYMTSYSRISQNQLPSWEEKVKERQWLYQSPVDILIKASNGASDFGNKFGQPLITGSVLTFEHHENDQTIAYDKVIMQAGGIGYAKADQAKKDTPQKGDRIVILGGDNYRIGMGGAAVSSADTGGNNSAIELNAIQRSNPEMQKRVANAVRGMVESRAYNNSIVSIHDHGAGGHLNCLSELVEDTGGKIDLDKLPVGDPSLSAKELIGNESQERMGLVINDQGLELLQKISERERAPIYNVGEVTGDMNFSFTSKTSGESPINMELNDMFGSAPKTIITDESVPVNFERVEVSSSPEEIYTYTQALFSLEAVGCKDWLTNKVDRCVGGKVVKQQCVGALQLPLNNCGVMALDYKSYEGVVTSIGHAPLAGLIDPVAGSRNAIAESLTNLIWAPLKAGLSSVSLSANWMWPCNNKGEDARLYKAVEAVSEFAIDLGINIPTGKDSLSMKQKYSDKEVIAPGTLIISTVASTPDFTKVVEPVLHHNQGAIYYINLSKDSYKLGGSSLAQILSKVGEKAPSIKDAAYFKKAFDAVQNLIDDRAIVAGHDIGSGGLITTLLELCFSENNLSATYDFSSLGISNLSEFLFSENIGIVFQGAKDVDILSLLGNQGIDVFQIGEVSDSSEITMTDGTTSLSFDVATYRDYWFRTSYLLDQKQSGEVKAKERFDNYKNQPLRFNFSKDFNADELLNSSKNLTEDQRPIAAVLREKGSNSEREMANALSLAGFRVKDVHMTDLISGRETLEEVQFLAAVGGFSNSDVLGSAKGWAGAFKYNEKAQKALQGFMQRPDTLSVGICNGCQLWVELGIMNAQEKPQDIKMLHNDSRKHESNFVSVKIQPNRSVMLSNMEGLELGIWVSHGEGKFSMPANESEYHIAGKYSYSGYPANPNGSAYDTAIIATNDGRHLASMPHFERSIFPWNWASYPQDRKITDAVSPWLQAFLNARLWINNQKDTE